MSDGKNALKLPGYYTDFTLNLKIILSHLMLKQAFMPKKTLLETFDFLVSFVPSNISVRQEIQGDKRIEIMS